MPRSRSQGFKTSKVRKVCQVAPSTLQYWVNVGLVGPSLIGSSGHRFDRWWSVEDLVAVRLVKALRDAGCPLQQIRAARDLLHSDRGHFLIWDGQRLFHQDEWGDIESTLREPGQMALAAVVCPVAAWRVLGEQEADTVDLDAESAKRARGGLTRRTTTQPLHRDNTA